MAAGPYAFYRGSSHLFWGDFYRDWWFSLFGGTVHTQTWIQGDAHVYNFGAFSDHRGTVLYGLDDFDDAIVGDYQYDLWRFSVSLVLDMRENGVFDRNHQGKAIRDFARAYLKTLTAYSADEIHKQTHYTRRKAKGPLKDFLEKTESRESRRKMLDKLTQELDGKRVFHTEHKKLAPLTEQERARLLEAFARYRQTLSGTLDPDDDTHFHVKDMARRLWAGTGSLGRPRYFILVEGDEETQHDDIVLDVKRQEPPPAYAFMRTSEKEAYHAVFNHEGERHAEACRAMAERPDNYLGWLELPDGVYSVRERSPFKKDFPTDQIEDVKDLRKLAKQWGLILATEHKRGGRWLNGAEEAFTLEKAVAARTSGRENQFIGLLEELAFNYADCVTQDYHDFLEVLAPQGVR